MSKSPDNYPIAIGLFEPGLVTSKNTATRSFVLTDWKNAFAPDSTVGSIKVLLKLRGGRT